jgi:hypothetical protein
MPRQICHPARRRTNCLPQELGDAAEVNNNPAGVVYKATLPKEAFFKPAFPNGGNIQGEIKAEANTDGKGVKFTIKFSNLPKGIGAMRKSSLA